MTSKLFALILCAATLSLVPRVQAADPQYFGPPPADCLVMPIPTGLIQFCLHTNLGPNSSGLFNTFDIVAFGETLLKSPSPTLSANQLVNNLLVNGAGPQLSGSNGLKLLEEASGPGWSYRALDLTAGYSDRVKELRRGILYVEPDVFVLYDHVVAKEPAEIKLSLHPPADTRIDPLWHDLRLEGAKAGLRVNVPAERHALRKWERVESPADALLPGTVTMQVGPGRLLARLDLLTVFGVYSVTNKTKYDFKLLESNSALGVRIHRDGYPTLVAFRLEPEASKPSLTGFSFQGPVGVSTFRPPSR